jgi:hypothetical protein
VCEQYNRGVAPVPGPGGPAPAVRPYVAGGHARGSAEQHQVFAALDLNRSPDWEINLGVGRGFTSSTDHLLIKTIFGYRLKF